MAWLGAAVTLALLATAVIIGRRCAAAPSPERARRSLLLLTLVAMVALAAFFGVVTAANISTAAQPAPALLAFFEGGS
jgi:predicted secreted protein